MEATTEDRTMASRKKDDDNLSEQIGLRVTAAERAKIDELAERFPMVGRSSIVRAALLVGLDAIEKQPGILIGEKPKR
jgi:hypothetical protein